MINSCYHRLLVSLPEIGAPRPAGEITGKNAKTAYHRLVNCHIYEDQLPMMRDVQLQREPYPSPQLEINPDIKTLEDIETWVTTDDFKVIGYQYHDPIKYPFSE